LLSYCYVLFAANRVRVGPEYMTDDKVYCIYWAPNEEIIKEHARLGGFPANRISTVRRMMEPASAG
jgi:Nickel responsive protein SCO4226-like